MKSCLDKVFSETEEMNGCDFQFLAYAMKLMRTKETESKNKEAFENEERELTDDIKKYDQIISDWQAGLEKAEKEYNEAKKDYDTAKESLDEIKEQLTSKAEEIKKISTNIEQKKGELKQNRTEIDKQNETQKQTEKLFNEIKNIEEKLEKKKQEIYELKKRSGEHLDELRLLRENQGRIDSAEVCLNKGSNFLKRIWDVIGKEYDNKELVFSEQ